MRCSMVRVGFLRRAGAHCLPSSAQSPTPPGKSGVIGTAHLLELREGLRSLFQLDDAYGGDEVRSLAVRHLRRVRRIINTREYPDTISRQLQLVVGESAVHCGWLAYDADDQDSARRYWGEALTTATMLRDLNLEIMIFCSMSLQPCHEDRPRDGLDLARAAQTRAARLGSPVLRSLIAAREARALSLLREGKSATQRLPEAMRLVDRSDGQSSPEWIAFHGHAELDFTQGLLYTELGHHHAAFNSFAPRSPTRTALTAATEPSTGSPWPAASSRPARSTKARRTLWAVWNIWRKSSPAASRGGWAR